jgi:uncharacterized membrane protein HdeD (DUF308 family)
MTTLEKGIKKSSKTIILFGALIVFLGIIGIIYPAAVGKVAAVTIGIFLVIAGIFRLSIAFLSSTMGMAILRFLLAIFMIIAGGWTIGNPEMGLEALTMVLAIFFIIDGLTEIGYSLTLIPIGGGAWFLFSGIISVILGVLIFSKWPESSNYALGLYVGIKLLFDGLSFALTGWALGKASKSIS